MSIDFERTSFGDIDAPQPSSTQTWNDVWPSSNTSWDTYDPMQGFDMTKSSLPISIPNDYKPPVGSDFRVSNFGIELSRPDVAEEGPKGHLLFPFGEGPLNPRTAYDFWNPAQAIDTLATWARAVIPGVNDAGNLLGQLGKNLADSYVGKMVSDSPVAAAGSFLGDTLFGLMKGGFQAVGDVFAPIGDITKSYEQRDFAGMLLNTLRFGPVSLGQKTGDRIQGFMAGDEKLKEQLADELGFFLAVATLGAGTATGLTAKAATALERQAAKIGVLKAAAQVAEEGATQYTLNPILHNIAVATKFGLAGGYGLEAGSEIAAHVFPDWDNTNKFIASQTSVPLDSPFRGAFEMGAATFVDPMPVLGKLIENPATRRLMDSGFFRAPSPMERIALDMPGGWEGVRDKQALIKEMQAAGLERVAEKKLEDSGKREILDSDIEREVKGMTQMLNGSGERKFLGLASDYTNLQASITKEIQSWISDMEKHFPEYQNRRMTLKDLESHWDETKADWAAIKAAQKGKIDPEKVMIVRKDVVVDKDVEDMINHLKKMPGFKQSSSKSLTDEMRKELQTEFSEVIAYANKGGRGLLRMSQRKVWKELNELLADPKTKGLRLPRTPKSGDMATVAEMIKGKGRYKLIKKGSNPVVQDIKDASGKVIKDAGDIDIGRHHPAAKEAEELLTENGHFTRFDDGEPVTLNNLYERYQAAGFHDAARLLAKWGVDHTAMYSKNGILRPVLTPNADLALKMPDGANRWGTILSNFREMVPNTELGRKFKDKFFEVHNQAWGLTREEVDKYLDAIKKASADADNSTVNQWAMGSTPLKAGKPIKNVAIDMFGAARIGDTNPSQLLEKSMPNESMKDFVGVLLGNRHGEVGAGPSFFNKLRAERTDRIGDFYRWWANVGHPMIRYDISPLFNFQLPFESKIYNFLNGAKNPSTDGLLAPAVNEAIDKVAKSYGGKTMGEQRGIGLLPSETTASERVASRSGASQVQLREQAEFMYKQVMKELPSRFIDRMKMVMPEDYDLLRRSFKSDKELFDAVVGDSDLKRRYLSGKIDGAEVLRMGKVVKDSASARNFTVIEEQLHSAMRDSVLQAQTTHISNPMRRYWERSFSHPVLMYPLSWTLKATGEWARFLTHSAFGLRTGMAGNVAWGHIQDATMRALINDPDAMDWVKNHPETIKIMEYVLPGLPGSPIPGDKAGVGFGLMSVPLRNAVQTGWNMANGRPLDENMSDMSKIGLFRDLKVMPKLWSEWALGKPQTTIDNPGLTVGKKRHPQAFDQYVNDQLGLTRR